MKKLKNIKIRTINVEHSETIQQRLLKLGAVWSNESTEVFSVTGFIYVKDNIMTFDFIESCYIEKDLKEVTLDDLYSEDIFEVKFEIGDRFGGNGTAYLLAQVYKGKVALINIEEGNRWIDPIEVNNVLTITESEFNEISNHKKFTKLE